MRPAECRLVVWVFQGANRDSTPVYWPAEPGGPKARDEPTLRSRHAPPILPNRRVRPNPQMPRTQPKAPTELKVPTASGDRKVPGNRQKKLTPVMQQQVTPY